MKMQLKWVTLLVLILMVGCQQSNKKSNKELSKEEAKIVAKEAYIYGFPLVMNYKTLYANVLDKNSGDYKGDFNKISCEARLYTPEDKAIVTVNSDTPYCMFWSDVRNQPVIFSVPDVNADRYYSFQFIDLFTHNFAYLGSLTKGNKAGKYMVADESWNGIVPDGINEVIKCETGIFFTIVRTQLFNENDLSNLKKLQDQYKVQTLSEYLGKPEVKNENSDVLPQWVEGDQLTEASFKYMHAVFKLIGHDLESEKPLMEKFAKLGIATDQGYDFSAFDKETQDAIKEGVKEGFAEMQALIKEQSSDPIGSTKIFGTRKFLETSAKENYHFNDIYLIRAVGAYVGIYGNSASEAMYPTFLTDADGNTMDASQHNYTLTFAPNQLPPVKSFWSITMYDGKSQLLVNNSIDKYLVNSTTVDKYVKNKDGSITIYMQYESPGKHLQANWLPAPNGSFYCVMRLYGPKEDALNGTWITPKIIKQTN